MSDAPKCHHIMDSGRPCGTPPLKGQPFCYYHRRLHADFILPGHPQYMPPALESRHSVQIALNHIYVALSKNLLDRKQARTLLYTIKLVQNNLNKGVDPSHAPVTEINPAMQRVLHLDDAGTDTLVRDADPNIPRSTDTVVRCAPVCIGVNNPPPLTPETDPARAIERSNQVASKKISPYQVPEFCPELDLEEWQRITRDLPPKGDAGTAQQQMNARRVLQVLNYDGMRRRMTGAK